MREKIRRQGQEVVGKQREMSAFRLIFNQNVTEHWVRMDEFEYSQQYHASLDRSDD